MIRGKALGKKEFRGLIKFVTMAITEILRNSINHNGINTTQASSSVY